MCAVVAQFRQYPIVVFIRMPTIPSSCAAMEMIPFGTFELYSERSRQARSPVRCRTVRRQGFYEIGLQSLFEDENVQYELTVEAQ